MSIRTVASNSLSPAVTVTVKAGDKEFEATVRIDTPNEWQYYRHGGILHYVLRSLNSGD